MSKPSVGVVGLGSMGGGVAKSLLRANFPVRVCDVRPDVVQSFVDSGAIGCATPAELGAACDVAIVLVVNAEQVDSVLFGENGAAPAMRSGSVLVMSVTVAPDYAVRLAARLAERGIAMIDGAFWVADTGNRRVLGWLDGLPVPGQGADVVLGQADLVQSVDESRVAGVPPQQARPQLEVLERGEGLVEKASVAEERRLPADFLALAAGIPAEQAKLAAVRAEEGGNDPQEGRLPRPVSAREHDASARRHLEGHVVHGDQRRHLHPFREVSAVVFGRGVGRDDGAVQTLKQPHRRLRRHSGALASVPLSRPIMGGWRRPIRSSC